jgi:hypothetical protein
MTIKLTGVVDPATGLKDFEARYNGDTYLIKRVGTSSKFSLMGCTGTRNDIKQKIVEGYFDNAEEPQAVGDEPTTSSPYDCVHPAALLALLATGNIAADDPEILRSLDSYGYAGKDGSSPDIEAANAEYSLWSKRSKGSVTA